MELLLWLNHNFYASNEKCSNMVERNGITFKTGSTNTKNNVYAALNVWIFIINCYKTICFSQHIKDANVMWR